MRLVLRVLSPLLALALTAAGALVSIEVFAAWWVGDRPGYRGLWVAWRSWQALAMHYSWSAVASIAICLAVAVIGVVLLLIAGLARRGEVRLNDPAAQISVTASPQVVARLVGQRVRATEEIVSATVRASARSVRIRAIGRGEQPRALRPVVRRRAGEMLEELPLARRPRVSVSVHAERGLR